MCASRVGVVAALLLSCALTAHAQPPASPATPPQVLNVVRAKLKPKTAAAYAALEASIVRAYDRAKVKVYWIGLRSTKDPSDILYLNLHNSVEQADQVAATYQEALKLHPEITRMQDRLTELTASTTSMLTTRRDDVEHPKDRIDFATMRALRLTVFQVKPGREGEFVNAIRTARGSWIVYEANETSTFVLLTLKRSTRSDRRDGPAIPRTLRRFRGTYTKAETRVYAVRPAMSHMPATFAAAGRAFWQQR